MEKEYQVVIAGGGLAGLTCALHLKKLLPNVQVLVLERESFPLPEAAHKVGESTVELSAHYFNEILGLQEHFETSQLKKLGLRFFFPAGENNRIEERVEFGSNDFFPSGSNQIDRGRFENFLAEESKRKGITLLSGVKVKNVISDQAQKVHTVEFTFAEEQYTVATRWIIDASGRASLLKKQKGLEKESGHHCNAAWFRIQEEINIDTWVSESLASSESEWRKNNPPERSRWLSTNHLMGKGYWVWLIPLASGSTSVGIVADPAFHPLSEFNTLERAMNWLQAHEPQCAEKMAPLLSKVQDFIARKHYSTKCTRVFSDERWGILGDAGIFIDPFYSPGSDYIAIGNTFLTDLIRRDLSGERWEGRAELYDHLYRLFSENTFLLYENQYGIWGNPIVMPIKVLWDYAVYWSFLAFVVMQGKLCDVALYSALEKEFTEVETLNRTMQEFFHKWAIEEEYTSPREFIDVRSFPYLYELNRGLTDELSAEDFIQRLHKNIMLLKQFSEEIKEVRTRIQGLTFLTWSEALNSDGLLSCSQS